MSIEQAARGLVSGSIRFNTDSSKMEIYNGEQWWEIDATSPELQTGGTRGVYWNSINPSPSAELKQIDTIQINTTGNSTDFGDSIVSQGIRGACGSRIRGICGGAYNSHPTCLLYTSPSPRDRG